MATTGAGQQQGHVALLAEGVDRNSVTLAKGGDLARSPSSRRAWIEIQVSHLLSAGDFVALLAEGVDRNQLAMLHAGAVAVSPSSRRAWIEIPTSRERSEYPEVALLAEGVDRNTVGCGSVAADK